MLLAGRSLPPRPPRRSRLAGTRAPLAAAGLALALVVGAAVPGTAAPGAAVSGAADSGAAVSGAATPGATATVDPRLTQGLYVEPSGQAHDAAAAARRAGATWTASRLEVISTTAQGHWFGDWNATSTVRSDVATYVKAARTAKRTPLVVIYAITGRDCGGYSGGGLTPEQYKTWITKVAEGLGDGAVNGTSRALVVLEPDAVMQDCAGTTRNALLRYAAQKLAATGAWVYLDGGHSSWRAPADTAARLKAAGVGYVRGFATNVSNFRTTASERTYTAQVAAQLKLLGISVSHRHAVVDTSRNGRGPTADDQWCNPPGRGLGYKPSLVTSGAVVDAFLWVKRPGESDGACNGGPGAGAWWQQYALDLVANRAV